MKPYIHVVDIDIHPETVEKIIDECHKLDDNFYDMYGPTKGWQGLPLKNRDGTSERPGISVISAIDHKNGGMWPCKENIFIKQCPTLQQFLNTIPGEKYLVRLLRLLPHEKIVPHKDSPTFDLYTGQICRLHLPLITDPRIKMYWNNSKNININTNADAEYHLEKGKLYFTHVTGIHWVENPTDITRVHLVIDVENNPELKHYITKNTII